MITETDIKYLVEYFNEYIPLMDTEIYEEILSDMSPCIAEDFAVEYIKRHREKFNQDFCI